MRAYKNVAILFSDSFNGHPDLIDKQELRDELQKSDLIKLVIDLSDESLVYSNWISEKIKSYDIDFLILIGNNPGWIKAAVSRALYLAGKDTENIELLNLKQLGFTKHSDTKNLISYLVQKLEGKGKPVNESQNCQIKPVTLVLGAGIAGIQSALELANAGQKVILVEKSATIGGHMAKFDKTFPTLDCAACILTPKMVEVAQNPNIQLLTLSDLLKVERQEGNFKIRIRKNARRVDEKTCIGCGSCSEKCPGTALSEFDEGMRIRKAIYIPFPQAVPNKYLVDAESCTYLHDPYLIMASTIKNAIKAGMPEAIAQKLESLKGQPIKTEEKFGQELIRVLGEKDAATYKEIIRENTGKCKVCMKTCNVGNCINLDAEDEILDFEVGNIIVATGFKTFDASRIERFGYGKFDQVLTSLELERLINAAGPTEGYITLRTQDKKGNKVFVKDADSPQKIAIVHCVGSRDHHYHAYCSRVCCMYSLKLAHLVREKLPNAEVTEYYIDMRAFGKGYEEFYERISNEKGIHVIRGKTARVLELQNKKLLLRSEDMIHNRMIEDEVDMLVLSVGLEAKKDAPELASQCGISLDENLWFKELNPNAASIETQVDGIYLAGACQGPKDIPDSVAQASAAAARVIQRISVSESNMINA